MTSNHKLTGVIGGRVILSCGASTGSAVVAFSDGSTMTVLTAAAPTMPTGGTIAAVRQQDTVLELVFADGSAAQVNMADETSCVMVRGSDGTLQYAD